MGLGTKVDYDEALKYFRIAYQQVPFPGLSIAYMTENGLGVEKNPQEATRIYKELSDKGVADAHMFLGWKYYKGIDGVNQNHTEALRLFQLAEKNAKDYYIYRQALYGIGYVYFYSETNQNQNEGVKYMRQAAEKGDDLAKEFLKINNLS
jgi:tetratricopeptide (TPR) repeat protein